MYKSPKLKYLFSILITFITICGCEYSESNDLTTPNDLITTSLQEVNIETTPADQHLEHSDTNEQTRQSDNSKTEAIIESDSNQTSTEKESSSESISNKQEKSTTSSVSNTMEDNSPSLTQEATTIQENHPETTTPTPSENTTELTSPKETTSAIEPTTSKTFTVADPTTKQSETECEHIYLRIPYCEICGKYSADMDTAIETTDGNLLKYRKDQNLIYEGETKLYTWMFDDRTYLMVPDSRVYPISDISAWKEFLSYHKQITSITIDYYPITFSMDWVDCSELSRMSIYSTDFSGTIPYVQLTSLEIHGCLLKYSDICKAKNIQSLTIIEWDTTEQFDLSAINDLTQLSALNILLTDKTGMDLSPIANNTSIEKLSLQLMISSTNTEYLDDIHFESLYSMKKLSVLRVWTKDELPTTYKDYLTSIPSVISEVNYGT